MKLLYGRDFHRALQKGLAHEDRDRCRRAIEQFQREGEAIGKSGRDWFSEGLNYEPLGHGSKQNHCSIRASRELRVILAVEPDFQRPETVVVANMGHHDPMYNWAERQNYFTATEGAVSEHDLPSSDATPGPGWERFQNFEEWQLFPHPDQAALIKRQYPAEARVRGAAGTGKTVVALHRAAELGHRYGEEKVLFTTFHRALTNDLEKRYRRLPNRAPNVEFLNIDSIAFRSLEGARERVDPKKVDEAFKRAYFDVIPDTALARCDPDYLKEEIVWVIKGRGASEEEYLDTDRFERLGRRRKFNRKDRRLCWQLREAWDQEMRSAGTPCFEDRLNEACDRALARNSPRYRAAIVDEAQDMKLVGMRLVRALVAGKPDNPVPSDGLLIMDDAAQRIYAGGFRLKWAGLQVTGRSEVLQKNYRNARQIAEAATAIRGDTLPIREDEDDGAAYHTLFEHEGEVPRFTKVGKGQELAQIAETIDTLVNQEGFKSDEIAVLSHGSEESLELGKRLKADYDLSWVRLSALRKKDVQLSGGIRVGTFDVAKGFEFRAVLISGLGASRFPKAEGGEQEQFAIPSLQEEPKEFSDEEREARQLDLDRLYVGMTRARERLYLIADEAPGPEIQRALDQQLIEWQRLG